ncbi:unnamed protein product [Victoria cruziana]
MGCFPCFHRRLKEASKIEDNTGTGYHVEHSESGKRADSFSKHRKDSSNEASKDGRIAAHGFSFRELATATKNFNAANLIGEGGFGRVYKGRLESTGQVVAVKQLDRSGLQGNREFLVEVLMLSLLHHSNLVNLIGYCADGDQRLLVYEYMPMGSLEDHLFDIQPGRRPLDWNTRMKIAVGAAKGPVGGKTHVSTRVMGTYGYCAPEYAMTGQLTLKSDVYSFGVVLLELITGRKAIDTLKPTGEQYLVTWSRPYFKDRRKFTQLADPLLEGHFPIRGLHHAIAISAMCLQEQANTRPLIGDIVTALEYLASQPYVPDKDSGCDVRFSPSL